MIYFTVNNECKHKPQVRLAVGYVICNFPILEAESLHWLHVLAKNLIHLSTDVAITDVTITGRPIDWKHSGGLKEAREQRMAV